jgi:DNA-binding response OmpR family regulator
MPMITRGKILVADDEPNIVTALEFLLHRAGYEVVVAHDGQEALEAIARERPDLVLLDVTMPRRSGFEVCQAVKSDARLEATRVLLLSARSRDTDMAKGLALGADAYMTKPFSTQELLARVAALLGDAGDAPA